MALVTSINCTIFYQLHSFIQTDKKFSFINLEFNFKKMNYQY